MTRTIDRVEAVDDLERLWAAPAVPEPSLVRGRRRRFPTVPGRAVGGGWIAFFLGVRLFEPAPTHEAATPLWGEVVVASFVLALAVGALVGPLFVRFGFAAATIGGSLGMVVAIACRATGHHMGAWWLVELGVAAALTGLAGAGLAQRLRS